MSKQESKQIKQSAYKNVIIRERWTLVEAIWLLHGVFIQTNKEYGAAMELFYGEEFEKKNNEELEIGRLSEDFIDRMLKVKVNKSLTMIRIRDWKIITDSGNKLNDKVKEFWHLLNCHSDIKQCEVSYVDENGKWYALVPGSQWNADYLIKFAQEHAFDIQWLIDERNNKTAIFANVIPFRRRESN